MNPPAPPVVPGVSPPPVPRPQGAAPPVPVVPAPPRVTPPAVPQPATPPHMTPLRTEERELPPATKPPVSTQEPPYEDTQEKGYAPHDTRSPLPPGSSVHHYTIISRLGRGGYGITYRARHTTKGSAVVIKEHMPLGMATRDPGSTEISFPTPRDEEHFHATMAEFLEEITVLRALEYPGIVPIIDSFEENDTAYYVMPFIAGTTLQAPEKISLDTHRLRMNAQRIRRILISLLNTLEYMEQHHIVHRDIKPDNILLTSGEQPVLLDFGSARQLQPGKVFANVFTPDFCAPEQSTAPNDAAMSSALGPWTDLYSLGATFYYLISHLVPPNSEMRVYSTPDPYKPLASRPDLQEIYGADFLAGIDRAMELKTDDRWQSATAWRESLEEDTYKMPPKVVRNIRIFGGIAALAFTIVGGLAIYAFSERSQVRAAYNSGLNFTESILYDFSTELTDIPGSTNLQRHLSANLQKYLTAMRDLPIGQDGRLDRSLAAAWFNIGCMHLSLGNLKDSREALQRAQELESMICNKRPGDQRFHYELARTYLAQASLAMRQGNTAESAKHASAAVSILEKLHSEYPDNPNYGSSLGEALAFETFYLRQQGNYEERKQLLDRLLALHRNLFSRFPRHVPSARGLGHALHYRGRYAKDMGDYAEATRYLTESYKIFLRLTENYPYQLSLKKGMAEVLHTMGDMYYYQSLNEVEEEKQAFYRHRASETLHEHIALVRELRQLDANNPAYLLLECRALAQVGNIQLLQGEVNEAEAQMHTILENTDTLLLKEPDNSDYISTKALALCSLALAHSQMTRNKAKASIELAQSRELLEKHIQSRKNPPEILISTLMEVLTNSAVLAVRNGELEQALAWLEQAEGMLRELTRDAPRLTARQKLYDFIIHAHLPKVREKLGHPAQT